MYLEHQNYFHPKGSEVVRILRGITDELGIRGNVLVIGDSTSAYCVDRERELSWSDLREKARSACGGVNFYFESWSGATPRSFLTQANNASWWGLSYDWVLLIGGWNSDGMNGDEIKTAFAELFSYCCEHLVRK